MTYDIAEQEIVDQVNAYIVSSGQVALYEVALMPETEFDYKEFYSKFNKSRVAVEYKDSDYEENTSAGIVSQAENVKFRLTFESKKLRGPGGLYQFIGLVKKALIGFRLTDCDRLVLSEYSLLEFEQGAWQPYLEFKCKAMNVQFFDDNSEPDLGGPLASVSSIEDFSLQQKFI